MIEAALVDGRIARVIIIVVATITRCVKESDVSVVVCGSCTSWKGIPKQGHVLLVETWRGSKTGDCGRRWKQDHLCYPVQHLLTTSLSQFYMFRLEMTCELME